MSEKLPEKATYTVPRLMDGYQIAKREEIDKHGETVFRYYLQQRTDDGWRDVRGPYKQSTHAKEWLRRERFRELMAAKKRGAVIVFFERVEG